MPKINIEHPHKLPAEDVRARLDKLNHQLSSKYGIEAKWSSATRANFSRTGATGSIQCETGRVVVSVDLSFALSPIKGKVEERIRDELAKALA